MLLAIMFMKTAIVSIIKNKLEMPVIKKHYRLIALVTAASIFFKIMFARDLKKLLVYTRSTIWFQK